MSHFLVLVVPFAAALATSLAIIPWITRFAVKHHLLDEPDGMRRSHAEPVPRLGGVAIFAGLVLAFVAAPILSTVTDIAPGIPKLTTGLVLASGLLFLLGLWDDLRDIPPLVKLGGQTLAAFIVVSAGFRIDHLILPPAYELSLGWAAVPVTVIWLVGVSNALNLVDGLDGLAGGVSVIALLAATAAAMVVGNTNVPWYTLALGGAVLGFLRFNFPPARIFLGDSGSLVVGFLLAVFTVKGATRNDQAVYALAPIFALSFPLLDTGIAMLRRWLRGTPLSRADARHIHHQLRALGLSPRKAVTVIYVESAIVAVLGLCVTFAPPQLTIAVAVAGAAVLLFIMVYGMRWLEYHEFLEAGASVTSAAKQARWVIQDKINARDVATLVRRARTFDEVANVLEESAPIFRFAHIELCHRTLERHLPPHVAGELHTARFCKLEYPIAHPAPNAKPNDFVTLNIWCTTETLKRPVGAERVARILAPAISHWLDIDSDPTSERAAASVLPAVSSPERPTARRAQRASAVGENERAPNMAISSNSKRREDEVRP